MFKYIIVSKFLHKMDKNDHWVAKINHWEKTNINYFICGVM